MILRTLPFVLAASMPAFAQVCPVTDSAGPGQIYEDVRFLSNDLLEGRLPGTAGEQKAAAFIAQRFQQYDLQPKGDGGSYLQAFDFPAPVNVLPATQLVVDGKSLRSGKEFFPFYGSPNGKASGKALAVGFGIRAPELNHDDYAEKKKYKKAILIVDLSSPDGVHPHSKFAAYTDLETRLKWAAEQGAAGVVFINPGDLAMDPPTTFKKIGTGAIPAVMVLDKTLGKSLLTAQKISLTVAVEEVRTPATNVVGLIDNGAAKTVVIGAHFDHLGWGEEGSLSKERAIHNGADDNASGTAGLMDLARQLSHPGASKKYNYLLVAFSAEEKGLLGSKFFTNNLPVPAEQLAYMFNMDMIGRFDPDRGLEVAGTGTSPTWDNFFAQYKCPAFKVRTTPSGVGPSDHTSFYYLNLPVLHFFTGTHADYHKPSDDVEKISYHDISRITNLMVQLIQFTDGQELEFTKTAEQDRKDLPRFSVTLGIMPDYAFEGPGVRLEGTTEGKAAQKAGLQRGDIILKLGTVEVKDVMGYMGALAQFKPGDTTTVEYQRGAETQKAEIKF
jgi:hypothetical protein